MYSKNRVFNDELIAKKHCNGRLVKFDSTSGTGTDGNRQVIYFNQIAPTSTKRLMSNFMLSGEITLSGTVNGSAEGKTVKVEFLKNIMEALTINVTLNGSINYECRAGLFCQILQNYSEKYKSYPDTTKQFDYDKYVIEKTTPASPYTVTFVADTDKIHFNVPLMHPLVINNLSGVSSMNVRVTTDPSLYSIMKFSVSEGTLSSNQVKGSINVCTITYEESDVVSDTFKQNILYPVVYQKSYSTNSGGYVVGDTAKCSSDVHNTTSAPSDLFIMVAYDGQLINSPFSYTKSRTERIKELYCDINNDINILNGNNMLDLYKICKMHNYQGSLSDFMGIDAVQNNFSPIIRVPITSLPVDINTNDIFRANIRDVVVSDNGTTGLTLFVVYMYNACLTLSPEKSEIQYIKNDPFVGEIMEYSGDEDVLGAGFFDKIKGFFKNQGISKLANTVSGIANVIKPGNGVSGVADKVGTVASLLGASTSVF